ncbi:peroxiredoxin type-2 [Orobanche gracilis]
MEVDRLQRSFLEYTNALILEGFLDGQFGQLQQLQDETNPDFVSEIVSIFFDDSERILTKLTIALDQKNVDFKKVDADVHQLKGSSSSIGAQRVTNACIAFRNSCEEHNLQACRGCLEQVKQEYLLLKTKLETLLSLEQKIAAAGGLIPKLDDIL